METFANLKRGDIVIWHSDRHEATYLLQYEYPTDITLEHVFKVLYSSVSVTKNHQMKLTPVDLQYCSLYPQQDCI